jgi:hypothetical protein
MEIFVLRTASNWEQGSGAAVLIAETQEHAQELLREYEFEDRLVIYTDDDEAAADVTGPTRHTWVEVERFPIADERERIVLVSWDEKI